jgi:uncharacterized membrane protein YkvA (DUF1232 family)
VSPGIDEPAAAWSAKTADLPAVVRRDQGRVRRGFWRKLRRVAGRIPFAEDAAAMYYCAIDPATPIAVRAALLAALVYFIVPTDLLPDFIAGLGFTDDATVISTTLALAAGHVTEAHRRAARRALEIERGEKSAPPR